MKKFFLLLSIVLLLLIIVLVANSFRLTSRQYNLIPTPKLLLSEKAVLTLSEAVQIKTIAYDSASTDSNTFRNLNAFLQRKFPLADSLLEKKTINSFSLLYTWKGKNPTLKPVILLAHMDVVPPEGTWDEAPFGGTIKNGYIWGRGTLDDKVSVLGILEATEKLLSENYTPERTIYFAFGHDEETGGGNGASKIAEWFREQKIEAEFILDEGLVITDGVVPGISKPVALIGVAEKGYMTLRLSVNMHSGHSSMPEKETAIGVLASALSTLEKNPFEARLSDPAQKFLESIGPEMDFLKRIIFANTWLFEGLIINTYEKTSTGNALVRTTIAPAIVKAGVKENVIPEKAVAIVNLRILPGDSKDQLIREIKEKIKDQRITIEVLNYQSPSPVSSDNSIGYQKIDSTIRRIFPDVIVAPSLMIAGTDSKHYLDISGNVYRFLPVLLTKEDISRIHGSNERVSVDGYLKVISFYYSLLKSL